MQALAEAGREEPSGRDDLHRLEVRQAREQVEVGREEAARRVPGPIRDGDNDETVEGRAFVIQQLPAQGVLVEAA